MKKLVSLILAVVSTMLLVTGATQAAEKFDPLAQSDALAGSDVIARASTLPCDVVPDQS